MKSSLHPLVRLAVVFGCFGLAFLKAKTAWDPVPPEDLAATACKSFPGANAEILFNRTTMESDNTGGGSGKFLSHVSTDDDWRNKGANYLENYTRTKIYSLQGADNNGVKHIEYPDSAKVWDLCARVIKPDGHIAEYSAKDFSKSVVEKKDGEKWMRQVLAVPDLAAGDIVEMQWAQTIPVKSFSYYFWYCQSAIPTREYIFDVVNSVEAYDLLAFNVEKAELKRINDFHGRLEMRDIPPFEEEDYTLPMRDVRGWFMLFYTSKYMSWSSTGDVWERGSAYDAENFRLSTRPNAAMKAKVAELTQGSANDEEKLQKLYQFCQTAISNLSYFDNPELQKAKKKLDDADREPSASDIFKRGSGYRRHINLLFASLAQAAGFEVRLAQSASRDQTLKVKNSRGWLFMSDALVAIRQGEAWRFFSPGDYYMPFGLLRYTNELTPVLVCDEKKLIFDETRAAPAAQSLVSRTGRFTLDAEGTLEGEVEVRMGGHRGAMRKSDWHEKTAEEIDTLYRESISKRLQSAEVSELKWENLRQPGVPLIARYKIRIPGYAELAGSRIVFVPNFFEHGGNVPFSAEKRKYPILFSAAWSEHDEIEITLPEGYMLDGASSPSNVGDPATDALGVKYKLGYRGKQRLLSYKRDFSFGGKGNFVIQADKYLPIKTFFDAVKHSDEHSLILKPKAPAPAPTPAAQP